MSLTCAAGNLKQHDTSLAKSRDVASTPLSGAGKPKAPCTLHVALDRTESGRLQDESGLRPLKRFEDGSEDQQVPQGRDLYPARSTNIT